MAEALVDVDLDALAPAPKRVRLGGKVYKLPGDIPFPLFLRLQSFEQRAEKEDESELLSELQAELLSLFQVHQPQLKKLPDIGVLVLIQAMGAIFAGGTVGEPPAPNRATRRQKKRTTSAPAGSRAPRTSR